MYEKNINDDDGRAGLINGNFKLSAWMRRHWIYSSTAVEQGVTKNWEEMLHVALPGFIPVL